MRKKRSLSTYEEHMQKSAGQYTDAFTVALPESVNVYMAKGSEAICTAIRDLEEKLEFTWCEAPQIPYTLRMMLATDSANLSERPFTNEETDIEQVLMHENKNNGLGLINMGDLGFGVIAERNFQEGELLKLYTGQLEPPKPDTCHTPYGVLQFNSLFLTEGQKRQCKPSTLAEKGSGVVNALCKGNITRFMQHFPTLDEMRAMKCADDNILTANVVLENKNYCGHNVIAIYATRPIAKNDFVGFSYGWNYWQAEGSFFLFNRAGLPCARASWMGVNYQGQAPSIETLSSYGRFFSTSGTTEAMPVEARNILNRVPSFK